MSVSKLEWPTAFRAAITAFIFLCGWGIIGGIMIAIGIILGGGLSVLDDPNSSIPFMVFFIVGIVIFTIGGLASTIKVAVATARSIEWPEAFKASIIATIYICGWVIVSTILGVIADVIGFYKDILLLIAALLILIGVTTSTIKSAVDTVNKLKWSEAFEGSIVVSLYIIGWLLLVIILENFGLILIDIGITIFGEATTDVLELAFQLFLGILAILAIIGGLASTIKSTVDIIRRLEWPTSFVHRKSFKDRSLGVWKQYYEVKHGIVGLILVLLFLVMALVAPIVYPKYPGQLARVGPDYAAPAWTQFTDPDSPPYKNYLPDYSFEDDSAWNFSVTDPLTGLPDEEHGFYEFDTTDFTDGSRSLKLTLIDNSTDTYFRTSIAALQSFNYNYTHPIWVTVSFNYKSRVNGTLDRHKLMPYVRFHTPENSPYPDYLSRIELKPHFAEEWTRYTRNMSFLSYYFVFAQHSEVNVEVGLEFSNPFTNPFNPLGNRSETVKAEFWFDNLQIHVYSNFYGWLGTSDMGQDVMAQLLWGAQISLFIGLVATFFGIFVGLIVGLMAGYFGGSIDEILMRIVDFFLIMPGLPIMMILAALFTPSLEITTFIIALFAWPGPSRVIRSQVLVEKEKAYVEAAKAAGAGDVYLIFKHVLPNVLTLVFVQLATGVSSSIISEAGLSFLALTPQNLVSWGRMLQAGYNAGGFINNAWWFILPPGFCIALLSMGFVFIGYAVDNAMNPRQRRL
ncbi:MAG: ABC transporter permease [Candidatus Heimdallarchaeota archaeon]|nr:MAG: ABC transporter permease [Candidatus Heimdallarchaeota archaeon]